jgi:hypothetical protein
MRSELTMASRVEITRRYAKVCLKAGKKDKCRVLDEVVAVAGWSREECPPPAGRSGADVRRGVRAKHPELRTSRVYPLRHRSISRAN